MRYFILAGEQSGDLHGSNLARELFRHDSQAVIKCWGGDHLKAAGAELLMHIRDIAFMGFLDVIKNLGSIKRNLTLCKNQISDFKPDVIILIDYPGFNLRIAEFAHNSGFRVFYYISPKLWAWKEGRIEKIRKFVDRMYIIFPFEIDFYGNHNIDVEYRGNPLLDETEKVISGLAPREEIKRSLGLSNKPVVALLAGSRKSEVKYILPKMLSVIPHFTDYQFIIAGVGNTPDDLYKTITGNYPVTLIKDKTYEILHIAEAALVKSGTSTLEAALFRVPQVVCYKGDLISMLIAQIMVKVKFISLVNLIAGYEAVIELVQNSLNEKNLVSELKAALPGGSKRAQILRDYEKVRQILGPSGASERVAKDMIKIIRRDGSKA
jgi:lipid-A-disaccharide synthase